MTVQPDGKILVGGSFNALGGQPRANLGRLNPDGSLDPFFDPGATYSPDPEIQGIFGVALQSDGRIVVAGGFTTLGGEPRNRIGRLHPDGSLDRAFDPSGTFGADSVSRVDAVLVEPGGRIIVGGIFATLGGQPRNNLARLNADGSPDMSFNLGADNLVRSLSLQADGKILVGGHFKMLGDQWRKQLGRINPDGSLDMSFQTDPNSYGADWGLVFSLAVQADGKILAGGSFNNLGGQTRRNLGRLTEGSAALQNLSINPSGTVATWNRNAAGSELEQVTFERSFDGGNYTLLGDATRVTGGWQIGGLILPVGQSFYLRTRGRTIGYSSSGVIESVAQFYRIPPAKVTSVSKVGSGAIQFAFSNTSGASFKVLAATNIAEPLASWEVLGSPVPVGNGLYQFTDSDATNHAQRFYQLRSP